MARRLTLTLMAGAALAALASGPALAQSKQLFFYNWSNYYPPDLLKKFEAETGIAVTLDVYDSNETMLAKLQAGAAGYDVIVPSSYMLDIMIKQDMLLPLDKSKMPNFGNVSETFADPWFDPGRAYSAPYMWGTTGYSYDSAKVEGPIEESWAPFFDPEGPFAGKLALMNDQVEVYDAAAYYLGIDKCTTDPKDAARILELLEKQKPAVALYNSDGTIERMIAGEVVAHMQWNGAAHRTKEGLPTAVYVYPKEGITVFDDNFAIPKGAPNPENAMTFINWMMDPENIAIASNYTGYMNAIDGSEAFLDPALRDDPAVNMPAEYADRLRPTVNCPVEAIELRDRVWTRLRS
jgi:spermidine/putrescine transport system substrate-binding protein